MTCPAWTTRWISSSPCGFASFVRVVVIRAGSAADAAQIAAVQREGWFAAYEGIIPAEIIHRVTIPDNGARVRQTFRTRPWQRMLVAVAAGRQDPGQAGDPTVPRIVGYASFGPETDVLSAPWPHPMTTDGEDGSVAELYALYVRPAWWSTGTGRALMERVLARTSEAGYRSVTLWVLRDNHRARRFYERAGFAPDGATNVLRRLGVRHRTPLPPQPESVAMLRRQGVACAAGRPCRLLRHLDTPALMHSPTTTTTITPRIALVPSFPMCLAISSPRK